MAKLLDNIKLDTTISKIVELGDELIVNGHVYDKNTFAPKSLDFCPIKANKNEILTSSFVSLDSKGPSLSLTTRNYMIDSNDPNITYVGASGSASDPGFYKIIRTPNNNTITFVPWSTPSSVVTDFFSQDSQYIYIFYNRSTISSINWYNCYIQKYDKTSLAKIFDTSLMGLLGAKLIKENSSYVYFAGIMQNINAIRFYKINKSNGAATIVFEDPEPCVIKSLNASPTYLNNNNELYAIKDDGTGKAKYKKYSLDIENDIVTINDISADLSIKTDTQVIDIIDDNVYSYHELFFHEDNNKKYLNHIVLNTGNTLIIDPKRCALYTYEIINETSIKLISYQSFSPNWYRVMMPMYNNKLLVLGNDNSSQFYSWNTANEKYEKVAGIDMSLMTIGADMNNNIYLQSQDSSIEMISSTLPLNIYVDFEQEDYSFTGNEINTSVEVFVKNYLGKYITSSLELYLYGPVKFTDTGLKTKIVTTSNLNKMNFPVTVYDSGILRVGYKIV